MCLYLCSSLDSDSFPRFGYISKPVYTRLYNLIIKYKESYFYQNYLGIHRNTEKGKLLRKLDPKGEIGAGRGE